MKVFGIISTTALFLLLGATVPAFAQEEHHEEEAKPEKQQEQAKPAKQQEEAKPAKQQEQAKPAKQQEAKPEKQQEQAKTEKQQEQARPAKQEETKPAKQQEQKQANNHAEQTQHAEQSQGRYAHDGQKDSRGHVYTSSRFGPDHHAHFVANGGRFSNGRREYSYGGYWFYASSYPPWFYQQDVYFIMGADGIWYAVAVNDPALTFEVNIG